MYHFSYAEAMEDSFSDSRAREREVLDRCVSLLLSAEAKKGFSFESIEALRYTRQVWNALLTDLTSGENQLPDALKANLISIGIWILKECDKLRKRETEDYRTMADIIRTVSLGLK